MLRLLTNNDVVKVVNLMDKSCKQAYFHGYERNEGVWTAFFLSILAKQEQQDPNYIAVGYFDNNENLKGFLLASTFNNYYTNEPIMDVKDCIVDPDNKLNAKVVASLFDYMIYHTKKVGGKQWRADSIHEYEDSKRYVEFLNKRYNCAIQFSARGVIE